MILKKITAAMLSLGILSAFMCAPLSAYAAEAGDVNNDGAVDPYDALIILQYTVKICSLSDDEFKTADMNNDGEVNAADALAVLVKSLEDKQNSKYSGYIGSYSGLFGEEKSPSYTAYNAQNPNKSLNITKFTMVIQELNKTQPKGYIILESDNIENKMDFSQMDSVKFNGEILSFSHTGNSASIEMDVYFSDNGMTGKIKRAAILATTYDFPCTVYFEKNQEA